MRTLLLIALSSAAASALAAQSPSASWPADLEQDRAYFCASSRANGLSAPQGFAAGLRDEIARRTAGGSSAQALDGIAREAGCAAQGAEIHGWNWPAVDAVDNVFLCSDHRGAQPDGYGLRVNRALMSRISLGMGLQAASRDIHAQGGCPEEADSGS